MHAPDPAAVQTTAQRTHQNTRNYAEDRFPAAEQARTKQSVRSGEAYVDWTTRPPSERPLVATRGKHAAALFEMLRARSLSHERLADMIGVTKSVVQRYLSGKKPIPSTILDALPADMRAEFLERVSGTPRVEREIERLDMAGCIGAQMKLAARMAKLATEGR